MAYTFDNIKVAKLLVELAQRGNVVNLLCDAQTMGYGRSSQHSVVRVLVNANVNVRTYRPPKGGQNAALHSKMLVVRGWLAITGSANWTFNSWDLCVETSMMTRSSTCVKHAEDVFDFYWARGELVLAESLRVDITNF